MVCKLSRYSIQLFIFLLELDTRIKPSGLPSLPYWFTYIIVIVALFNDRLQFNTKEPTKN